jgi:hypothetical protein
MYSALIRCQLEKANFSLDEHTEVSDLLENDQLVESAFSHVSSTHLIHKYFVANMGMVEPVEYVCAGKGRKITFQYVPLLSVLKVLLQQEDVFAAVMNSNTTTKSDTDVLEDFTTGEFFAKHPVFGGDHTVLRIHLYTDELEIVNPLGSKKKKHKMCVFYFTLGNLLAKYRSQLRHVYLSILFPYRLLKEGYTYSDFLKPLIGDLKTLQKEGITVTIGEQIYKFIGAVATISTDNLSAHSLAGFA